MDVADRADSENEHFVINALYNHHKQREQTNHHASSEDKVRYCVDCGKPIPAARLKAVPEAIRCVECQKILEKRMHR